MDCSTPGFPVHHQLPELVHLHPVSDAIQTSHPLSSPSPPVFNLSQHQGLFKWVSSSYQVAKVLKFQLQHQSFQWIFRTDFLLDWLLGSPCCPRDSQEASSTTQFKSINSSALSFLYRNGAIGLATFQVLQDKTNSIHRKLGLQFGHRLTMISVCVHPGIISRNAELQSLTSHPRSGHTAWDPFPNRDSRCAVTQDFKSGCWSKPNFVMYSLLFLVLFSFNASMLKIIYIYL